MDILEVIHALDEHLAPATSPVTATTPNGSYTFDVVNVEGGSDGPVLRLVERELEPATVVDGFGDTWVRGDDGRYTELDVDGSLSDNAGWRLETIARVWGLKP